MELFNSSDVFNALRHKFVIIIGDSIHRSIYKDLVLLLQKDRYLSQDELRSKGELCFMKDELIEGGQMGEVSNGINYREFRQFKTDKHHVRFYFVTRCYNTYIKSILLDIQGEPRPDIVLMNSGVWDLTRYGTQSVMDYRTNIVSLFYAFQEVMTDDCLVVWNTTLPVSQHARGGFLPPDKEFRHSVLAADINAANEYTKCTARFFSRIQVLDLHAHLWKHSELQVHDGIHWDMMAHRFITNLIMELVSNFFGAQVHHRSARPCPSGPPFLSNPFNSPMLPLPCHQGHMSPNTPISHRRGSRFNRRFRNPDCLQNSFDCQSPYSDTSVNDFHSDFHSPVQFQTPNYIDFESPNFSHTPIQFQTRDYFYSPPNNFESPSSLHENDHSSYLSPVNNQSFIPSPCTLLPNSCQNEGFFWPNGPNFNPNNRNSRSRYAPLLNNVSHCLDRAKQILNLGQYSEQGPSSGVIRHKARRGRQHQPYKGNQFR